MSNVLMELNIESHVSRVSSPVKGDLRMTMAMPNEKL